MAKGLARSSRRWLCLLLSLLTALPVPVAAAAAAQPDPPDSSLPLAEPVVDADAILAADRGTSYQWHGAQALLLEGGVEARVGSYGFRGDRAVVRIDREIKPGRVIRHLSILFDNARPIKGVGPTEATAPRLLVTVATKGQVKLSTNLLMPAEAPPNDPLVRAAADRFAQYFEAMARRTLDGPQGPIFGPEVAELRLARREAIRAEQRTLLTQLDEAAPPAALDSEPGDARPPGVGVPPPPPMAAMPPDELQLPEPTPAQTVLPRDGIVSFTAERIVFDPADESGGEATVSLMGNVSVIFQESAPPRELSLRAQNVVIFIEGDVAQGAGAGRLDAAAVKGVYLEDNVIATDGQYTLRGTRVYYDAPSDRAVVLDAVLYAWDPKRKVPLYLRAEQLRQESADSFAAERARFTTSEFATPHFHIGASELTLREVRTPDASARYAFSAENATLNTQGVPFFYWPRLSGQTGQTALRRLRVGYDSDNGPEIETAWDVFALIGRERPRGVDLLGRVDYLGERGPALGADLDYGFPEMFGQFKGYFLPFDSGEDQIGGREDIEQDNDLRGFARWQHRQLIKGDWELSLEGGYVSDETFLEEFFPDEATESKPYETSVYLKRQQNDWAFDVLASYSLNDFVAQTNRLQIFPYSVEKLPEVGYYQIGTSLLDDRLTYFTENRASAMRIRRDESSPADRGFRDRASLDLFGVPANQSFEDSLAAAGVTGQHVGRLDSRHELQMPMRVGIFDVVPYATGRVTGYDEDFNEFAGNEDQVRLFGAVGTRLHTQFHNTWPIDNRLFDLHRLRHIAEPRVDLFVMGSTLESDELPVFDPDVEALAEGAGVRLGMTNTLQTQRGGDGRWRSVDWIVLNTDLVLRSDDADIQTDIARFFSYRPEFSVGGDHFYTDLMWMISDTMAFVSDMTYGMEEDSRVAQWRAGFTVDHSPDLTSFVNYGEIDATDSRLLTYGFVYRLTVKYTAGFSHTLDFGAGDSRNIDVWLERRLPRWRLRILAEFDEVDDSTSIGVVLLPEGVDGGFSPLGIN